MATLGTQEPRFVGSLLGAVRRLQAAREPRAVREGVRDCALAIEFRLDTLARELDPARGTVDPSLVPAGRAVETELRAVLLQAWRILAAADESLADRKGLDEFVRAAAIAARREAAFAFSQLSLPEALD